MRSVEILERLMDSFDEVEVFLNETEGVEYELKNSRDFSKGFTRSVGCGIRALKDSRLAFGFLSIEENTPIDRLVEDLKKGVILAKEVEVDPIPDEIVQIEKSVHATLDETEAKEKLEFLDETAKEFDKRVSEVKSAAIAFGLNRFEIANSKGLRVSDGAIHFASSVSVLAKDGDRSEAGWYSLDADNISAIDFRQVALSAASEAVNKLYGGHISTKKYSVTIKNSVFNELLTHFFPIFSAYSVIHHTTALEGKLSEQVFSEQINIADAVRMPQRPNKLSVDHEGNLRKDTVVVKNGVLESFLSDTYSASRLGVMNTANAKRGSWKSLPEVGAFNFYIKPGSKSKEQLLNKIDGIYITQIMGLHMANRISGDFSFGIEGFLMHNGEPVSYFKSATFADNFYEMMKRVIDISNNMYFFGSFGSPDIAIADCTIGGE